MTGSRIWAILCEILKFDIEVIESVLAAIKNWYGSTKESLSDKQAKLEKKSGVSEYDWDDLNYEFDMLDRTKRVMYASVAVSLSSVAEDFLFSACVNVGLIKVEIVKTDRTEKRKIKGCKAYKIKKQNWGTWWDYKEGIEYAKVQLKNMPFFCAVNRIRLLSNCFKHSNGRINGDFAKAFGGKLGDDIHYESEKWEELISGCQTFLTSLLDKMPDR